MPERRRAWRAISATGNRINSFRLRQLLFGGGTLSCFVSFAFHGQCRQRLNNELIAPGCAVFQTILDQARCIFFLERVFNERGAGPDVR